MKSKWLEAMRRLAAARARDNVGAGAHEIIFERFRRVLERLTSPRISRDDNAPRAMN